MYNLFYGLEEQPFNLTPDSKYLFLSHRHQEALAALLFGVQERKGFIALSGEIGSGKTTLTRALLAQLDPKTVKTAVILNSYLNDLELLKTINEEFGLSSASDSKKALLDQLNRFLIEEHQLKNNVVLILDESQNLRPETLEQIRMISNLETETDKLIQIILVGQPELRRTLALPELEQLNQRITVRYHVTPLEEAEIGDYIKHRLAVAKAKVNVAFTPQALRLIYHYSKGIPRRINVICDRALLVGYVLGRYDVDGDTIQQAVEEVRGETGGEAAPEVAKPRPTRWKSLVSQVALGTALVAIVISGVWFGAMLKDVTHRGDGSVAATVVASAQARHEEETNTRPASTLAVNLAKAPESPISPSPISPSPIPAPAKPSVTPKQIAAALLAEAQPSPTPTPIQTPTPTPTPIPLPIWKFDRDQIVRVQRADHAAAAAYVTLLRAWGIEVDLAPFANAAPDQISKYDLPAMVRQLNFQAFSTTNLTEAIKLDMPMLVRFVPGAGAGASCVAILRMQGNLFTIADPLKGIRNVKRSEFESSILEITILFRDADGLSELAPGQTGEKVVLLQQIVAEAGISTGEIDGKFGGKLSDGLRSYQEKHALPATGRMNPMTAAFMSALRQSSRPRLYS